jgi:hypothetical protein
MTMYHGQSTANRALVENTQSRKFAIFFVSFWSLGLTRPPILHVCITVGTS